MRNHRYNLIGVFCSVALFSSTSLAADSTKMLFSGKVKVDVTAPENIKALVTSYLNRELRSLSDVELVAENAEWEVHVLVMEPKLISGSKIGIALSTVVIQRFDNRLLGSFFEPKHKDFGLSLTSGLSWFSDNWLNLGSVDDLQTICKAIIALFDTKYLEEDRRSVREINRKRTH